MTPKVQTTVRVSASRESAPWWMESQWVVGAALAIMAAVVALQPSDYFVLVFNFGLITAMLVVSLELIFGHVGLLNLAHAAYFGIGAYASALITKELGMPFGVGVLGACLVAGILGYLLVPMGKLSIDYYAMGTLAFGLIVHTLFGNMAWLTGGWTGLSGVRGISIFGMALTTPRQHLFLLAAVLILVFTVLNRLTTGYTGRTYKTVRDDEVSSRAIGIPVDSVKVHAVTIGCVIAGLAGSLMAHTNEFVSPESFGFLDSVLLLLIVVVAGRGHLASALFMGIVMHLVDDFFGEWPFVRPMLYGGLIVLCMIFLPDGIAGFVQRLFRKRIVLAPYADVSMSTSATTVNAAADDDLLRSYLSESISSPVEGGNSSAAHLLECRGLGRAFGGIQALLDFSIAVRAGDIHGLIGPNGAGKSTALNLISGLDRQFSGEIYFSGRPLSGNMDHRARTGVVRTFQRGRLFMSMSVMENVAAGVGDHDSKRLLTGLWARKQARKREKYVLTISQAIIRFVGLTDVADVPVTNLPFGRRRLVELARALAAKPKLLLLDEPAAGLNPMERRKLMDVLLALRDEFGITVILVEHDIDLVSEVSDRITVLHQGSTIAEDIPERVLNDPRVRTAYLGSRRGAAANA